MRKKGFEITNSDYLKLAYVPKEDILGWLYEPQRFNSSKYAVVYNDFTNEAVEIDKEDIVNIIEYKYLVIYKDEYGNRVVTYVLNERSFDDFISKYEDAGFKLVRLNKIAYHLIAESKDNVVYEIVKVPEDIYVPHWLELLEKYDKYVTDK